MKFMLCLMDYSRQIIGYFDLEKERSKSVDHHFLKKLEELRSLVEDVPLNGASIQEVNMILDFFLRSLPVVVRHGCSFLFYRIKRGPEGLWEIP